jgi:replicative DNA helicase
LVTAANEIANDALEPQGRDAQDIIDEAERTVFAIAERGSRGRVGLQPLGLILPQVVERVDERYHSGESLVGLSTGFKDLDAQTSGLQPGDLIIVAGRPSMGKTTLAVNIAENVALRDNKSVAIFSMEMSSESLGLRMLSSVGRINQSNLRSGRLQESDWPRIDAAMTMLSQARIFVDETPAMTPTEVRARARRLKRERGALDLIVVDYLQLMTVSTAGQRENRATVIAEISRSLKALAKELALPVIALSQLNRGVEQRVDKKPVMSDLRESGGIEQDADVILLIYREDQYDKNTTRKGIADIIIAKQRNGPTGDIQLTFLGQFTKFEDYIPEAYFDARDR